MCTWTSQSEDDAPAKYLQKLPPGERKRANKDLFHVYKAFVTSAIIIAGTRNEWNHANLYYFQLLNRQSVPKGICKGDASFWSEWQLTTNPQMGYNY